MDVERIIAQMTLEEKAAVMMGENTWKNFGVKRLGLESIFLSDGPNGLRKQAGAGDHLGLNASVPATCFPTASAVANSWNIKLGEEIGQMLGDEAAGENVNVLLGPGLNIKRSPLCGRNFEYFSEDPVLAGKMAAAYIRGIQSQGVAACPKHFAVNSQEYKRMASDSVIDERTLRELYLAGFEIAVKEGNPLSIMSSYNMVNGVYANENKHLLTEILRDEWGFEGFVVSDWGGSNNRTEGTVAGANLEMPAAGPDSALGLINDVKSGRISESVIDDRLREIIPVILELSGNKKIGKGFDIEAHHKIAEKAALEGIVLLENDGILPVNKEKKAVLIGEFAEKPRYQGAGSSMVNPTRVDSLTAEFEAAYPNYGGYAKGYVRTGEKAEENIVQEAVKLASGADIVFFCMGLDEVSESEGMDRRNMDLPKAQVELLKQVVAANKNIVLVLSGGAPFVMPEKSLYRAVVHGYLSGQSGAKAMYKILTGEATPSGKLSETWPLGIEDTPTAGNFPCTDTHILYKEGLYVGYRYYAKRQIKVKYPFGYGLSYTTFEYGKPSCENGKISFTIKNTGKFDGSEIAQIYVAHKGKIFGPDMKLAAFDKVFLKAGEEKSVTIEIPERAFEFFNPFSNKWEIEGGSYTVCVAASYEDIRLKCELELSGNMTEVHWKDIPHYYSGDIKSVTDAEFAELYGKALPKEKMIEVLEINNAICDLKHAKSGFARLAGKIIEKKKIASDSATVPDLNILFVYNMPFRAIGKMTGGIVSMKMVDDIMTIVNGHFWKGLGRLIADFARNRKASKNYLKKLEG